MGHFHKLLFKEMIFPLHKGKNDGLRYESNWNVYLKVYSNYLSVGESLLVGVLKSSKLLIDIFKQLISCICKFFIYFY